jgi:alkanesulfonate monooxygenase SsuD/methylene tetrahydromethanopterin reductase-like flavin-dependent oxidoreductase (luciferase family)
LGARGSKAFARIARSYDGWAPIAGKPQNLKKEIDTLKHVVAQAGRNPDTLQISAFVDPGEDGVSSENLKGYQEAGADRLVLFSQRDAIKMANGRALEVVRRIAPTLDRARRL